MGANCCKATTPIDNEGHPKEQLFVASNLDENKQQAPEHSPSPPIAELSPNHQHILENAMTRLGTIQVYRNDYQSDYEMNPDGPYLYPDGQVYYGTYRNGQKHGEGI